MRRLGSLLPTVLLVALPVAGLSACGNDSTGTVTDDPAPSASASQSPGPGGDPSGEGSVDFELVDIITETAAGGATSATAVPLSDADAVADFTSQFETDTMPTQVQDAVSATEVPDDMLLYGAVVAVGCDAPTDVTVSDSGSGLVITAEAVPSPKQECFAPMTTVALVLVPASAV